MAPSFFFPTHIPALHIDFVLHMPSSLTQKFPATNGVRWFNVAIFTITTLIAVYGLLTVRIRRETAFFAVAYYIFSMLGEKHIFY